jgi:hypothetical protein
MGCYYHTQKDELLEMFYAHVFMPMFFQRWHINYSQIFVAYLEDNGEPGRNDVFQIWINGILQNGDGTLL